MRDWKAELNAFVAETKVFTKNVDSAAAASRPQAPETVERVGLTATDWGGV
ncbi:hypothetical protein [Bradyrhizobium ganzhouense]|uniref:hypothetical protein n=1 Tax=Bradyrhizobium ganzhouense TaxID=1179767 RepID=UPI003CEA6491